MGIEFFKARRFRNAICEHCLRNEDEQEDGRAWRREVASEQEVQDCKHSDIYHQLSTIVSL